VSHEFHTAEMKFGRCVARYCLLDYRINEDILEELVKKKLAQYKQKCLNHFSRMEYIRYPKQILDYYPIGRRAAGQPLKRELDGYNHEAEIGHLLT